MNFPIAALVAVVIASAVTWVVMLLVARLSRKDSEGGFAQDTITRFMGLIVLSMGVQFALTGLRQCGI